MDSLTNIYNFISDPNLSILLFFIQGYIIGCCIASLLLQNSLGVALIGIVFGIILAAIFRLLYSVFSPNVRVVVNIIAFLALLIELSFIIAYDDLYLYKAKNLPEQQVELDTIKVNLGPGL